MAYSKSKVSDFGRGKNLTGFEYCHQVSNTSGEKPSSSDLAVGEIALNAADGVVFYRGTSGDVEKAYSRPVVASIAYAATVTADSSAGDIFDLTLTGNVTLANPTNPVDGKTLRWRIRQDGTGNRTVTLGSKFVIPSSATSPLPFSTAANKMDVLAATYHAGRDKWDIVAFVPGY